MSDLYRLQCDQPWHTERRYDGGEPHYVECFKPVEPDYEAAEAEYLKWSVVDDESDIAECKRQARLVVNAAFGLEVDMVVVPVEPVDVVEMADHIDGWFTVSNVYAPDLPKASYRVAIVIMEDDDE